MHIHGYVPSFSLAVYFSLDFYFFPCFPQLQCPPWDTFKTLLFISLLHSFIVPLGPALSSPNFLGVCPCVPEIQTPKRCFHASSFVPILWDWILSWRTSCFFMCRGRDMECLSYCWLLFFLLRLSF